MRRLLALALLITAAAPLARAQEGAPPIHVDCRGTRTASPTVILVAGAFGTSADWDYVLDDLAAGGRVCAYDRAGLGGSAPNALGATVLDKAEGIGRLLDQIGETGKVILVGHSNGALYAEAYARTHPDRVAGLVYINGVTTQARNDPRLIADLTSERRMAGLAVSAADVGLAPVVADRLVGQMTLRPPAAEAKRKSLTCKPCLVIARDEDRAMIPGLDAVASLDGEGLRPHPGGGDRQRRSAQTRSARVARRPAAAGGEGGPRLGSRGPPREPRLAPRPRPRLHRGGGGLAEVVVGAAALKSPHQTPTFGIEVQGSAGGSAPPFCRSSMEMPSGERTKAMCPSRGGRLMVTPPSISRWQAAWMSST